MSTLSGRRKKKVLRNKLIFSVSIFALSVFIFPYLSARIDVFLSSLLTKKDSVDVNYLESFQNIFQNDRQLMLAGIMYLLLSALIIGLFTMSVGHIERSEVMRLTDKIIIPKAVGEGQFGTARFLREDEILKLFRTVKNKKDICIENNGGLVIGQAGRNNNEILYLEEDVHTILIAATRGGKTRRHILESIWLRARTGLSMVVSDPKGELFLYTKNYLEQRGYKVLPFDLRQPRKSKHYNYLDRINRAVDEKDIPKAIDYAWDLVSVLVGIPKGEPLWSNGESAVLAAAILIVSMEAEEKYRNMTNVYYFIMTMCKEGDDGELPIDNYFGHLPEGHPARAIFGVANLSPGRTRGSFFGSALATLRLFTNWNIAEMTASTEIDLESIGKEKTALFIIVPYEKTTMYSLVSLFINQIYVTQSELANKSGGRIPVEIDFYLDEFGNFPVIPSFGSMLSVGAGLGMRFVLVIQDFQQIESKYKEDFENIKGNCLLTLYLCTSNLKTQEELSKRTGKYTVQVNSVNNSVNSDKKNNVNYSNSANMQGRELLLPDEIGRMASPDEIAFFAGNYPAIIYSPDLNEYVADKEFGMGNKKHNKLLQVQREEERPVGEATKEPALWGIWKEDNKETKKEKVSFLDLFEEEKEDEKAGR